MIKPIHYLNVITDSCGAIYLVKVSYKAGDFQNSIVGFWQTKRKHFSLFAFFVIGCDFILFITLLKSLLIHIYCRYVQVILNLELIEIVVLQVEHEDGLGTLYGLLVLLPWGGG